MYDLLHSYAEGVPFAVEERSGIVTVIRDLDEFDRTLYEFEAVAAHVSFLLNENEVGLLIETMFKSKNLLCPFFFLKIVCPRQIHWSVDKTNIKIDSTNH